MPFPGLAPELKDEAFFFFLHFIWNFISILRFFLSKNVILASHDKEGIRE